MSCKLKKGINIWSFPVDMGIVNCMKLAKKAGFEGIELVLGAKGFLSMESNDKEILGYKKAADEIGIVINISSISGIIGNFGQANHSVSKAGMIDFTKSLALEVAKHGITNKCLLDISHIYI